MYKKENKYKDVSSDDPVYARLEKLQDTTNDVQVIRDTERLIMFLANLHFPTMCCNWESEESFNNLLQKYKIDITPYIKEEEKPTEPDESFDTIVEFVSNNNGEYKKELVQFVKSKLPNLPRGKISSTLRRLKKLGIIEQSVHETSRQKIISKGRYWDSHIGKGGN